MDSSPAAEPQNSALLTALTTEHFVLQTAYSSTVSEAGVRSTLYVMALSSSLVAMGFFAQSREAFEPFAVSVLPVVFLLGIFTVVRLVDIGLESMGYLSGIASIREHYRTLGSDAQRLFGAEKGRWPEAKVPSLALGPMLAFLGTTASMVGVVNGVVGGAAVMLVARLFAKSMPIGGAVAIGGAAAIAFVFAFMIYQKWRFAIFDRTSPINDQRS